MAIRFDKGFSFLCCIILSGAEVDIENFRHGKKEQTFFGKEGEGINPLKLKSAQIVALQELLPVFVRVTNGYNIVNIYGRTILPMYNCSHVITPNVIIHSTEKVIFLPESRQSCAILKKKV